MMQGEIILPGSWPDWARQVADVGKFGESGQIIKSADAFAATAGISLETSSAMMLWLGSVAMLNFTSIQWPSGIWHPAGLVISSVEQDGIPVDAVTNGFIKMVKALGLDPVNDTVKEGPSGLITRLENSRSRYLKKREVPTAMAPTYELSQLASMDTTAFAEITPTNLGNVRGLIYPSGRSFLSYLYDTPFFNALDELIQHGSLAVRGKLESHVLRDMNLSIFLPFYQGALANMLGNSSVQSNFNVLFRQLLLFWPTHTKDIRPQGNIGAGLEVVSEMARAGLDTLTSLMPPSLEARHMPKAARPMFDLGVGIRYAGLNRQERLTRIAVGVAFWRLASKSVVFELTDSDYAVAEVFLHAHESGSRLVEICTSKKKLGMDLMRFMVSMTADSGKEDIMSGMSQSDDEKTTEAVLNLAQSLSVLDTTSQLDESYRLVSDDIIAEHKARWDY